MNKCYHKSMPRFGPVEDKCAKRDATFRPRDRNIDPKVISTARLEVVHGTTIPEIQLLMTRRILITIPD